MSRTTLVSNTRSLWPRNVRAGNALKYIQVLRVAAGQLFVLCIRVSGRERKSKLDRQRRKLQWEIERRGGIVVAVVEQIGSGIYPDWICKAAMIAKEHGATLVAETTDRFVRAPFYHSVTWPDAQARDCDLKSLAWWADGVPLMTLLHPNASPEEVWSYQRKRGQWATGHTGGRPQSRKLGHLKRRRDEQLARVLRYHRAGISYRDISNMVEVPVMTVHGWIEKHA